MSKYTKKHYEYSVTLIKSLPEGMRGIEALKYAKMYKADNSNFSEKKFMKECGL
jgi:hypothetical protein